MYGRADQGGNELETSRSVCVSECACVRVCDRQALAGWLAGWAGWMYSSRYGSMEAEASTKHSTGQGMRVGQGIKSRLARAVVGMRGRPDLAHETW